MTKDEKAEDYDRLSYEYTQLNQEFKSQKRANKKLQEQLLLHNVSQQRELLERLNKIENWCYNKATDEDLEFLNKIFRSENCG